MALFIAVLFIAFFFIFGAVAVHAEDTSADTALTVRLDGTLEKTFTVEELQKIASEEGDLSYSYSTWNVFPTFSVKSEVHGPTVDAILVAAGVRGSVNDTGTVTFTSSGYTKSLTGKQLFGTSRLYYPNGNLVDHAAGIIPETAYEGAEPVPAIISLDENHSYDLCVGQEAPNEETNPLFVHNMAAGGIIDVSTAAAPRAKNVRTEPVSGELCKAGDEIVISSENSYDYDKICYTFDNETAPGYGCPIYNCGPKQDLECRPVIPDTGSPVILKVVVKSYGKQDSIVQRFTFYTGPALTVIVDGSEMKSYSPEELDSIPSVGPYDYSGYNSYPNLLTRHVDAGKSVNDIIKDATGNDAVSYGEDGKIVFTGCDGYSSVFTIGQLFGTERYYFPNAASGTDKTGGKAFPTAYEGKTTVPAVIDTGGDNSLRFGQSAPNDQNLPECVSYMLVNGVIEIITEDAAQCDSAEVVSPAPGSVVEDGTAIVLPELARAEARNKVYYIVDPKEGEIPGPGCAFYHYSPYNWPEKLFNQPVISGSGMHTVSFRVCAYGKQDSDVTSYTYYVDPAVPADVKAVAASYNSVKISWNEVIGATGYKIYRRAGSGAESLCKTLGSSAVSFTDKGLATGTTYTYRITAVTECQDGRILESGYSSKVKAKPVLNRPTSKLKAGSKKMTVSWKKVAGANGYVIYRSTRKSSGYKAVKTITKAKGSKVKYTDKKVKKGRKYYYKVRAYRKVSGKKVYSSYSPIKSAKVR